MGVFRVAVPVHPGPVSVGRPGKRRGRQRDGDGRPFARGGPVPGPKLAWLAFEALADPVVDPVARTRLEAPVYRTAREKGRELNPVLLDPFGAAERASATRSLPLDPGPAREESDATRPRTLTCAQTPSGVATRGVETVASGPARPGPDATPGHPAEPHA